MYSGDNRLESKTENGIEVTYEYDLNGNLISDSTGNRYSYDENNKLVYAKVDGEEVRYTIGLDGLRTSKTTDEGTVEYFADENGLVVSENSDQLIWGNQALAKKIGSNYYYYIYNAHGDVVMMLDESGNIVNSYSYDPWGVVTDEVETVDNSIKYAGEYYDEEIGLIYLRARYYDPSIGRFTQEDPARDDWNWYSYCGKNPIAFVDPSGLEKKSNKNTYGTRYNGNSECINGQSVDERVKDLEYGSWKISENGCELIAIYNALVLTNNTHSIDDIIDDAEKMDGVMWLGGYFGTKPKGIDNLFDEYDVDYCEINNEEDYNNYLHEDGVYVISVWNSDSVFGGIHTVAFTCDSEKNIVVYNRYSNVSQPYKYTATEESTGLDLFLAENGDSIVMYEVKINENDVQ